MSDEKPTPPTFEERAEHVLSMLAAEEEAAPADAAAEDAPEPAEQRSSTTDDLARREREVADAHAQLSAFVEAIVRDIHADPVVIEGRQTDWEKLRREDPAAFARKWP